MAGTRRPTVVTVMGILNIVFGSLSLLCIVCLGLVLFVGLGSDVLERQLGFNVLADQWEFMKREVPSYPALTISNVILGFVMGSLLLAAGIGLLYMQTWARKLS